MRNGEDHVHVLHWQQFLAAFREPVVPGVGLAFWTMPRTARVKGGSLIAALATTIQVATERGGTAVLDREEHAQLQPRQPGFFSIKLLPYSRMMSATSKGGGFI